MTGLVLEGGGVKGSYQAGVYQAFLDCGIKIDGVCGTSIGAFNGAMIACGKGDKLVEFWKNIDVGKTFGFSDDFIEALNSKSFSLNNLGITLKNIFEIIGNKGIESKGLKKIINEEINIDKLLNSPLDYGLVTVKAKSYTPLYLFKEDMSENNIKDYILASAYLPIFKMEKIIDDNYYIDGGFYDNNPVNMLLKKGYQKIYLVKIQGIGIFRKYDPNAEVIVISSKRKLGHILEFDHEQIIENIKMGYYDTLRVLKNYDGEIYVFKNKSEKFYRFLNRRVNKKLFKRVRYFFKTNRYKDTTLKALEYIMSKEEFNYYKIYNPLKVIRKIRVIENENHFIYNYVSKLKYFL